jgi:hypothetical protein
MRTNKTMLTHPTFLAKIQTGMILAMLGEGEKMGGHGHRVYIQNRKGDNVLRCSYSESDNQFTFYGHESVNITREVIDAVERFEKETFAK